MNLCTRISSYIDQLFCMWTETFYVSLPQKSKNYWNLLLQKYYTKTARSKKERINDINKCLFIRIIGMKLEPIWVSALQEMGLISEYAAKMQVEGTHVVILADMVCVDQFRWAVAWFGACVAYRRCHGGACKVLVHLHLRPGYAGMIKRPHSLMSRHSSARPLHTFWHIPSSHKTWFQHWNRG